MQKVIFLALSLFTFGYINGQDTITKTILINKKYFKGAIFPKDYKVHFNLGKEYLTKRFTPTPQEIETFESGLIEQINNLHNSFSISDPRRFFKRHKRQYLGYINNKGDSLILAQFVDRGSFLSIKRRLHFSGWKEYFIGCLSDFCYKYLRLYQFNLTTDKLEIP